MYIRKNELFVRYKLQLTKIIASHLDVSNIKRFAEKKLGCSLNKNDKICKVFVIQCLLSLV